MQEIFEKIKERLEEKRFNYDLECASYKNKTSTLFRCADAQRMAYIESIEIVNQVAEEYKTKECMHNQSLTNADRIRAMSDEELLDFLCSIETYDDGSVKTIEGGIAMCSVSEVEKWLQSEVEE